MKQQVACRNHRIKKLGNFCRRGPAKFAKVEIYREMRMSDGVGPYPGSSAESGRAAFIWSWIVRHRYGYVRFFSIP